LILILSIGHLLIGKSSSTFAEFIFSKLERFTSV